MSNVIWRPQPRQAAFMQRPEYECFYGGAAGGGKSDALVIEALRQVNIPWYKGLIIRKTYPQLQELVDKTLTYYPRIYPKARYNGSTHTWTFPSGAKIIFSSLQHTKDRLKFQGQAYDFIAFDELTHFQFDEYEYLKSRNRPNGPGTRVYIRSTGNPGGIGHSWVKARWITAGPPMKTIWTDVDWVDKAGKQHHGRQSRIFVPSSVFDNKALLDNDPMYVQRLAAMPLAERNALLYGDWDSFSGQVFEEWRNDPDHYQDRLNTHVCAPFKIPDNWPIYCGMDWGFSHPFSVGWYAIGPDRTMYRIKEYYGWDGTPNHGIKLDPAVVAREIRRREAEDPNLKGRRITRIGDPAIWGSDGTESIGDLMERERVYFEKGDHARLDGLMQCHYRLTLNTDGLPRFYCFSSCPQFIRTVPNLTYSETNTEDVDTEAEDHIYDEWRYVCMANPVPPRDPIEVPRPDYNPLDDSADYAETGRYNWYKTY